MEKLRGCLRERMRVCAHGNVRLVTFGASRSHV